jgi:hypothetical protein
MRDNKTSLGSSLIRTIDKNSIAGLAIDYSELAVDSLISSGAAKDIPIFGTLVKLNGIRRSVSEGIFVRKLMRFLSTLEEFSESDTEEFINRYPHGSDEERILGENLLLAIERLDDVEKPMILARFFTAYLKSQIDYLTFTRLSGALEKFNLQLLDYLQEFYTRNGSDPEKPEELTHELSLAGLVTVGLQGSGTWDGSASYKPSELGRTFLLIGFQFQPSGSHDVSTTP